LAKMPGLLFSGLDVGASKTAAVIAGYRQGTLRILGAGESATTGLEKGSVTDSAALANSIRQAFEQAERVAATKAPPVFVGYDRVKTAVREGWVNSAPGRRKRDLVFKGVPFGERILWIMPAARTTVSARPDGDKEARAVTAGAGDVDGLWSCVKKAGLTVQEIVYTPLAGAEALLSEAEKELGTILIDIGAEKTSASLFNRSYLKHTAVLPLCSEHIVGDLAVGLRITMGEARAVLQEIGDLSAEGGRGGRKITLGGLEQNEKKEVPVALVDKIIRARVQEMADVAEKLFDHFGCSEFLPGGVVLSGSGAQLAGLAGWMEKRLNLTVKVGRVELDGEFVPISLYNALGLVKFGLSRLLPAGKKGADDYFAGFFSRFKSRTGSRRESTLHSFTD